MRLFRRDKPRVDLIDPSWDRFVESTIDEAKSVSPVPSRSVAARRHRRSIVDRWFVSPISSMISSTLSIVGTVVGTVIAICVAVVVIVSTVVGLVSAFGGLHAEVPNEISNHATIDIEQKHSQTNVKRSSGEVTVNGYTRKNGTYVPSHTRSTPKSRKK